MSQYLEGFLLGNGAILTNVCILPLYPGLIAFLAGSAGAGQSRRGAGLLGLAVLVGVLTMMLALGLTLFLLKRSFSTILPWLLPATYGLVFVLGLAMLFGLNPFARLATSQAPVLRNPVATAYLYGLMLGPMTLPCVGPIVISAFVLGAGSVASLSEELLFFLAFGLGFGWPLVLLPVIAAPAQRRFTSWLGGHYRLLGQLAGALLVVIAVAGIWVDVLPNFV